MKDSRNEVFVAPPVGKRMKVSSVRISFFKLGNAGSLSPVDFFFFMNGEKFLTQQRSLERFRVSQCSTFTNRV